MAKSSGGYDYEFVDTPPKSLECSICLMTLRGPHVTTCCGNHFCFSCINQITTSNKPCPLCNESVFTTFLHKGVAREVNALEIYCPHKPQGCDWVGELGQVEKHLNRENNPKEKGCGFLMVECKYECGAQFQRRMIVKHEIEECQKRPMEVQMAFLIKKFESLTTESKAEIQASKAKIEAITQEHKAFREAIEAEVSVLKAENALLKKQVEIHSPPTSVPPFYFSIANYTQHKKTNMTLHSPPFYSHPGGYKMELQVYPNGYSTGQDTHLSVFVRILRGEYDDKLQWPFKGKIFIEIYDSKQKNWTKNTCIEIEDANYGRRSTEIRGTFGYGYPAFVSNDQVNRIFLEEDTCRFRVTEVQVI